MYILVVFIPTMLTLELTQKKKNSEQSKVSIRSLQLNKIVTSWEIGVKYL